VLVTSDGGVTGTIKSENVVDETPPSPFVVTAAGPHRNRSG
jgi:hypothetical protein